MTLEAAPTPMAMGMETAAGVVREVVAVVKEEKGTLTRQTQRPSSHG